MAHSNGWITGIYLWQYTTDQPDGVMVGFDADYGEMFALGGKLVPGSILGAAGIEQRPFKGLGREAKKVTQGDLLKLHKALVNVKENAFLVDCRLNDFTLSNQLKQLCNFSQGLIDKQNENQGN